MTQVYRKRCLCARLTARCLAVLLGPASALVAANAVAELPVPCAPCGGGVNFTAPGTPSTYTTSGRSAVVNQALERETFNWASFDIGRGYSVEFRQPASSSIALNRIHDASPSEIFGALRANGQVYLVNQNGILFKPGANVDVNTLLASSLDLNAAVADLFESVGITNAFSQAGNPAALSANGNPDPGPIVVEQGARIKAHENGRAILVGGEVRNGGSIEVSGIGGQALLIAAKDKVYILLAQDRNVRGLAIEIDGGGTVENIGQVLAESGNITLAGLAVNQRGLLRATTAVAANGTVRLQARDTVNIVGTTPVANVAGALEFGPASVTEILPTGAASATAADDLVQLQSSINVSARDITVRSGAVLRAPGGSIDMRASGTPNPTVPNIQGSIVLEAGSRLDVAGSDAGSVPAARNLVSLETRGNELADSPVQKNGPLFGATVRFDIRRPPGIANVAAAVATIQRGILERTASGGSITLEAGQRIDIASGAVLDVSGGLLRYEAGLLDTTKLIKDGVIVDIAFADKAIQYDAVLGPVEFRHAKWGPTATEWFNPFGPVLLTHYQQAYVEGKDAGSISIGSLAVNPPGTPLAGDITGTFHAHTVRGFYQRQPTQGPGGLARPWTQVPRAGSLALASYGTTLTYAQDGGWPFVLDGIADVSLGLNAFVIEPGTEVVLPAGGSLRVDALAEARIDGLVRIAGGVVDITVNRDFALDEAALVVGAAARLDVSGVLVNDSILLNPRGNDEALFIDGGSIALDSGGSLTTAVGSVLMVNGGLLLDSDGRYVPGDGGSLTLNAAQRDGALVPATLELGATLSGHVFAALSGIFANDVGARSHLTLGAESIVVGAGGAPTMPATTLVIEPSRLLAGGFTDIELRSNGGTITLEPGVELRVRPQYFALGGSAASATAAARAQLPSTAEVTQVAAPATVDEAYFRSPTSLRLNASPFATLVRPGAGIVLQPAISLGAGSEIETDVGGEVRMRATGGIDLRGVVRAPAGDIDIAITQFVDESGVTDPGIGYDAARAITLDAGGVLDAAGVTVEEPLTSTAATFASAGLVTLTPRAAGTITLSAAEAFVFAAPGSRIDVAAASGAAPAVEQGAFGAPVIGSVPLSGQAGRIVVRSANGIRLFADLDGRAAPGGVGGELVLGLDGGLRRANSELGLGAIDFPETALRVRVSDAAQPLSLPREPLPASLFGLADFDLDALSASGLDFLELSAAPSLLQRGPNTGLGLPLTESRIDFVGGVALAMRGGINLDAPIVTSDGGHAALATGYLRLGFQRSDLVTSDTNLPGSSVEPSIKYFSASSGAGSLRADASYIDLFGFSAWRGFGGNGALQFVSRGDIRLVGVQSPVQVPSAGIDGALVVAADTLFDGARIYPTTLSAFQIINQAAGGSITFRSSATGEGAGLPLSAAGRVRVSAERIEQSGRLFVPHGEITLDADTSLVLGAGSLTSVSGGDATVLFGRTQVGDWIYPLVNGAFVFNVDPDAARNERLPPSKRIELIADGSTGGTPSGVVDIRPGAVIDVLGGGTLLASEFVPGPGGTVDLVDAGTAINLPGHAADLRSFALLPLETGVAPLDPLEFRQFDLALGTQLRLHQPAGDLAAGVYAVLPPRYALLPGGHLLTRAAIGAALPLTLSSGRPSATADGLPLVAASFEYFGIAAEREAPLYRYQVETGAQVRARAEYVESTADSFFTGQAAAAAVATPLLPMDAGTLVLRPNADLLLGGRLAAAGETGGRGTRVDIAADDIFISSTGSGGSGVNIRAADLETLNADSLFIGGTRSVTAAATTIEQIFADRVIIDAGVRLTLPELDLAALERVEIGANAVIEARGRVPSATPNLLLEGDGALIRVSTAALPRLLRSGVPVNSSAVAALAAGATLDGTGSLIIDSAGGTILDGSIGAGAGGGIRIGAEQIALGMPPVAAPGLALDAARLESLGVAQLELATVQPLDLYGEFTLDLDQLLIDAPGLRGNVFDLGAGAVVANARIQAGTVTLTNSAGGAVSVAGAGSGTLDIVAGTGIHFATTAALDPLAPDDGDFDITGFARITFDAPALLATAIHAAAVEGDLVMRARLIGALGGGSLALDVSGALHTLPSAVSTTTLPSDLDLLGGSVSLRAANVIHRTRIVTPSGNALVRATSGDLVVDGSVAAAGLSDLDFVFAALGTPGGRIELTADAGDLIIDDGATVTVDGGSGRWNTDAGTLRLQLAQGALLIDGAAQFRGAAGNGARSGGFLLDAESIAAIDLGSLNDALDSGGFLRQRHFRVRGPGDLLIDAATRVRAQDIKLVADIGAVVIAGTLDASGARGGLIDVAGGTAVRLQDGAQLLASSQGGFVPDPSAPASYSDGYRGGQIQLGAPDGTVDLAGGLIDVRGTRVDASGALVDDSSGVMRFTSARNLAHDGLDMQPVGATLLGAHDIQVVGHRAYDAGVTGSVLTEATTFSNAAATIRAALGLDAVANVRVVPGVEIFTTGDLIASVPATTTPTTGLFSNALAAGVLTFRAGGNLSLATNGSIRDGILTQILNGQSRFIADTAHSWSLQLVAGANLGSADLLATDAPGDLVLGNSASIMTGNGDINLVAGGDISLGSDAKVLVVGRHFTMAEHGGLYDFDGTINIPSSFLPQFQFLRGASFPDYGGHLHIAAGGDLTGQGSNQFVSNWHLRMGGRNRSGVGVFPSGTVPQAWGLSIGPAAVAANATTGLFNQGIAVWGGGNIDVNVGGDISRIQLSIPTVGRQIGSNSWTQFTQPWVTSSNVVDEIGGGVASVSAGGSITGLDVFVARGEANVTAGGDIESTAGGANQRHIRFAFGDSTVRVQAGGQVDIGTVINHTGLSRPSTHPSPLGGIPFETAYLTYSPRASVNVTALGEVRISNRTGLAAQNAALQNLYPAQFEVLSARDDVVFSGSMNLFSNAPSGFIVAAAGDVRSSGTLGTLLQVDILKSTFPSLGNPALPTQLDVLFANLGGHSPLPVYAGDRAANVMIARDGIITGLSVTTAKRLLAFAGENLFDPAFRVQHVNEGDVSVFRAGNDILMPAARAPSGLLTTAAAFIQIGGPGEAQFIAGGDIDLGTAGGIASVGDTNNPALPDQGADLTLLAGIGDDLSGLLDFAIQNYLVDVLLPFVEVGTLGGEGISGALLTALPDDRRGEYVGGITAADWDDGLARRDARRENLAQYLGSLRALGLLAGDGGAHDVTQFRALDDSLKLGFLLELLYDELTFAGVEGILGYDAAYSSLTARNATAGHDLLNLGRRVAVAASGEDDGRRGYAAVEAFFPTSRYAGAASSGFDDLALSYAGDISSVLSTVQTQDGGSIRSAVPGGLIDAGATQNDAIAKADKDLGYIAFRRGDIKSFVDGNFNVNSTRVFAQNGGDILVWSSFGNIDAGRGAKTAATLSATTATFDESGNFVDEPPLEVAGSGIRNFAPTGVIPGSLFLFARAGVINAGDAGIGTAGSAFVDANEFQNFTNTDFGGDVAGFSTDVGGISLSLASVGDVAASATKATDKATADAAERDAAAQAANAFEQPQLTIISVEVLGFGG